MSPGQGPPKPMALVGAAGPWSRSWPGPGPGPALAAPTEAMGLGRGLAWAHLRYMYV